MDGVSVGYLRGAVGGSEGAQLWSLGPQSSTASLHRWRVVYRHFHDVQNVEPISVLVLGDSEKLLYGAVHSLGLSVGLGMEGA